MLELLPSLLTFGAGFGVARLAHRLRDHTPEARSLVDFVPAFEIVRSGPPAVILNKDGSFTAAFRFQGPDRASSTDEQIHQLAAVFSRAFQTYLNSWTFHVDLVRRPAPAYPGPGDFPDPVTAMLDEQRRRAYLAHGALYETQTFLCATFRPDPELYQNVLLRFQQGVQQEKRSWEATLETFDQQLQTLRKRLSGALTITPLGASEFLSHLHTCINGSHQLINDPGNAVYLDQVLATSHLTTGWEPRLDSQHLTPVSVYHLPGSIAPADLDSLNDLPFAFRMSVRFSPLDSRAAQKVIDRYTLGWFWGQKGLRDLLTTKERPNDPFVNQHAVEMMGDASAATAANQAGEHRFAYVTSVFLVPGPTRPHSLENARVLTKLLEDKGYAVRIETYNATAAYHGSIPGQCVANLRSPLVHMLPTAALLPLTALWSGLNRHPCQFYPPNAPPILVGTTSGSTPFRLYLHTGDLGHTVVVGPAGAGKSTLLTAIAAGHLRHPDSRVYFFDRDHSALLFARAAGAQHYDIGGDSVSFQPLARLDNDSEKASALSWLEVLASLQIDKLSVEHTKALSHAVTALSALAPELRTLEVLAGQIADRHLRSALETFTKGPYRNILGAEHDTFPNSRFQVFEMRQLLDLDPKVHLPVLLYLLDRVEADLDGSPTLIILDEAGLALLHPVFASRIQSWALTLRKKNVALVLAIQTLSQLDGNNSFSVLLQSCPTRIFLPNESATSPTVRTVYEACGLNERQIQLVAGAQKKRDYYFVNPNGARLFDLALTSADLAFYGTLPGLSLQETHKSMERFIAEYGTRWPAEWLRVLYSLEGPANQLHSGMETKV
jgi:type IV secretion/conjugal transfer VirB4 family ATPase